MMSEMCIFFCSFIDGHSFHLKKKICFYKNPLKLCIFHRQTAGRAEGAGNWLVEFGNVSQIFLSDTKDWLRQITLEKTGYHEITAFAQDTHSILDTTDFLFLPFFLQENNGTVKNTLKSLRAFESFSWLQRAIYVIWDANFLSNIDILRTDTI